MAGVTVDIDTAKAKFAEIESYDEIISAASGSADAGKRAIANRIVSETETEFKKLVDTLIGNFNKIEDLRVKVGAFTAVNKALKENFGPSVDEYLTNEVENNKADLPEVSPEDLEAAIKARKDLVEQYNALKNILEMWGEDISELQPAKRMSGPRGPQGKRGPRLPKNLQFQIDGKDRSATQNNLSSIYNTVCKDIEDWTSTKDLKTWLAEQGFNFEDVPAEFSYTLPNGKVLSGYLTEDVAEDDEDEDEEETDVEE